MSELSSSAVDQGPHVLQVGPLYVNHLRRWSERAAMLGCRVSVAGHVREGRALTDFGGIPENLEVAPEAVWESGPEERTAWLREVVQRLRPDLVQAHWLPTWGVHAADAAARPLAVTPWGSDLYRAEGEERECAERALAAADAVLARSPHMRAELQARGVPAERVHDVDLGVDLERFHPATDSERTQLRRELGLGEGPVVLSFRAGTALYNLDAVLEAFGAVGERHPDAALVMLTGSAPLAPAVRDSLLALRGDDRVLTLSAPHERVPDYMRAATVGVSIPDSDGSPSSVWEALACGLPLVLSDLAQVRDRVGGGGAARFVERAPAPVAAELDALLCDDEARSRMAAASREWAVAHVGSERQAERLGDLYGSLLGAPAGLRRPGARSVPSPAAAPPSSPS
jgi:glycosyltransferase involved in cell wall biosynthesis